MQDSEIYIKTKLHTYAITNVVCNYIHNFIYILTYINIVTGD